MRLLNESEKIKLGEALSIYNAWIAEASTRRLAHNEHEAYEVAIQHFYRVLEELHVHAHDVWILLARPTNPS
jgi:hypothetical protein